MKNLKMNFVQTIGLLTLFCGTQSLFADEDSYQGYDSIIKELTTSRTESVANPSSRDSFDLIKFHLGVGFISSRVSIDLPNRQAENIALNGFEALFAIDLFSTNWQAIGTVRSFTPEVKNSTEYSLREFDLLIAHKNKLSSGRVEFSIGGGMSARYLDLSGIKPENTKNSYTTPSTVLFTGLGMYFTDAFSTSVQLSYRNPLISDTIDEGSLDGSLALQGHF